MDHNGAERRLALVFSLCVVFGAIASITPGVAWGHWYKTLDRCIGRNCTCILYGEYTRNYFLGGDASSCIWVTFGPLIHVLYTIGVACFHGFRVLFCSKQTRTRTVMSKNDAGETIQMSVQSESTEPLPRTYWIVGSVLALFFTLYGLVHFGVFVDGYQRTCSQYKRKLEVLLGVHGTAIPVIYNRLSCVSVFDFMDYMHEDSGNGYRDGFIYTGIDLTLGMIASFAVCVLFAFASYVNVRMARVRY